MAALIGSRICHDLISPIGAIGNGIELMSMGPGSADSPELALVSESCRAAQARIRFFRVAFGSQVTSEQMVAASEARSILAEYSRDARQNPDWRVTSDVPRRELQIALLAYLCLETALPRGGAIVITHGGGHWQLQVEADHLSVDPKLWSALTGTPMATPPAAAHVQFVLLPMIAAELGRAISVAHGETRLTLTI
ncbi:histidine phosphotransferase family protein [Roseivivax sp. THAF40]|uniref:histidine phosphotransferase family protein n=1 Tax=Roseivivax sp. THAF40 TaxID=2587858 RepID=UPI0015624477|nr:histidine phosphotransferase family protein [Roseivivax sp. THAF40]